MDNVTSLAGVPNAELTTKITTLQKENQDLRTVVNELQKMVISIQERVQALETKQNIVSSASTKNEVIPPTKVSFC